MSRSLLGYGSTSTLDSIIWQSCTRDSRLVETKQVATRRQEDVVVSVCVWCVDCTVCVDCSVSLKLVQDNASKMSSCFLNP